MKKAVFLVSLFCLGLYVYAQQAKYMFYFIGDGMGQNHINTTEMYLAELQGKIGNQQLLFSSFPHVGVATTFSVSNGITDSSAAGTALASGEKTNNYTLGLRSDGTPVVTVAEKLKDAGWAVGIMTSVSIDHATPGAFYANVRNRNDYYDIGLQLAQTDFDFFGGGTFYQPYPKHLDKWKENNNNQEPISLYTICEKAGYKFAHGYDEYQLLKDRVDKLILIQQHEGLTDDYKGIGMIPYNIDCKEGDLSLPQITSAAIEFLSKKNTPFFMMVEGGAIDWASHSNDAATTILEILEFDQSIQLAYDFYLQHPDETLIVVTADHETGALGMGNHTGYTLNLQILQNQKMSLFELSNRLQAMHNEKGKKMTWHEVKNLLKDALGFYDTVEITTEEDAKLQNLFKTMMKGKTKDVKTMYKQLSTLSYEAVALLNYKAHLSWGTSHHSASQVAVYAIGVGAEQFEGRQDNTDIVPKIMKATINE